MANLPMPQGLSNKDLECVMLDLPALPVRRLLGPGFTEENFFYGDIPKLKYAQGPVAEKEAHVTLLFGIHPSETYVDDVMAALDGWTPEPILIRGITVFPSTVEGQNYKCVVLDVVPTANLKNANKRLSALPHTDRFTEYKPHVTLAYIKGDVDTYPLMPYLHDYYNHRVLHPTKLNLGQDS